MSEQDVRTPQQQLDNLDYKLASRLRDGVQAKTMTVPTTSPPNTVSFIMLEFARYEDRDEDLVDGTLGENYSNEV